MEKGEAKQPFGPSEIHQRVNVLIAIADRAGVDPVDIFQGVASAFGEMLSHWSPHDAAEWLRREASRIERLQPATETKQ